jgi:putative radical SAM enzyme (TIGR03279 family)
MVNPMSVRIRHIEGSSGFFREGDEIVEIDACPIEDQLDLLFNLPEEGSAVFTLLRSGEKRISRRLRIETYERAGLVFEEMRFETCRSRCTFCFVEQMPPGLRPGLYIKDDDYRLSFLFGNFITLNDVSEGDIRRIIDMHLSPLYLSVHAIDPDTRTRLFGRPMKNNILEQMEELASNGITMHAQIVLVPGVNDGGILDATVNGLFGFFPGCRSVAVVPVGLTAHRKGLTRLEGVTVDQAAELVSWANRSRERFRKETGGESFLHLSDEFYLMSDEELPMIGDYDDFPQISNGVGMCRLFVEEIESGIERISGKPCGDVSIALVTGRLGAMFLRRYVLPSVERSLPWMRVSLITVENRLFGETVGVSGLIGGADIIEKAGGTTASCIVLPPNALNHDGLLIDDMRPEQLESALGLPVIVPESTFLEENVISACEGGRKS